MDKGVCCIKTPQLKQPATLRENAIEELSPPSSWDVLRILRIGYV